MPPEEGRFASNDAGAGGRSGRQVTRASAAYALALPPELANGPGTGAAAVPSTARAPADPAAVRRSLHGVIDSLLAFRENLHGGSYVFTVSGKRTSTDAPMLVNGPQLGYTFPTELYEQEVHGGGYDARGVTVPGLPTVAIGYGGKIAWGMTTGNSKTIDSFIETIRRTDGQLEYLHNGTWKPADCRTEVIRYRQAAGGRSRWPAGVLGRRRRSAARSTGRSWRPATTAPGRGRCSTRCTTASWRPSTGSCCGTRPRTSRSSRPACGW